MYGIYENGEVIARFAAPMQMVSNRPVFVSDALSLKRSSVKRSAQRWELETAVEPLSDYANDLMVNMIVNGISETVNVIVPQNYGVIKKRTSTSTPVGTGALGATVVSVTSNVGLIPKGTFIRFANHSKIYMLTADLTGNGTMYIFPSLRAVVTAQAFAHRDDVMMPCTYDTSVITGMRYIDGILMDPGVVRLIEALP